MEEKDTIIKIIKNLRFEKSYFILDVLKKNPNLCMEKLQGHLQKQHISISSQELFHTILYLLVVKTSIIKDDFIDSESTYQALETYRCASSITENYYRLGQKKPGSKKILLLADTHLGSAIANMDMLQEIYDYASKNYVSFAFHLGDLFFKTNDFKESLHLFKAYYPNFIKTEGILGNHDLKLHRMYQNRCFHNFDLRGLSFLNPNFYMIPRENASLDLGDTTIHFNHRFYLNLFHDNFKITSLDDIAKKQVFFISNHDIHISGHLHEAFLYSFLDLEGKQKLYIGVPSLSNLNQNKTCALFLDIHYEDNSLTNLSITPLVYHGKVEEKEPTVWNLQEKNPMLKKIL